MRLDDLHQVVEVLQDADVAADTDGVVADGDHRLIQRLLTASGDEHVRALGCEAAGRGEADAGCAAGDQGGLACELSHDELLDLCIERYSYVL